MLIAAGSSIGLHDAGTVAQACSDAAMAAAEGADELADVEFTPTPALQACTPESAGGA